MYSLSLLAGVAIGTCAAAFPPAGAVWEPVSGSWDRAVLTPERTWEGEGVQEPQVVYQPATKSLRMWYRGGGWGVPSGLGVADSLDGGKTWTKFAGNPVYVGKDAVSADCAGQPWVYQESADRYWLFTTNNHPVRTCVAFSTDGLAWKNASKSAESVVAPPPSGTLFGNRAVWKEPDGTWRLLQECGTQSGVWQVRGVNAWPVKRRGPLRPSALVAAQPLQPRNP